MDSSVCIPRVDFRFASVEDTAEIVALVNTAFSVEKGSTGLAFTTRDRVSAAEVDACMDGEDGAKRWLILETPAPEEKMVAAALIFTGDTPGQGSVQVLAVEPSRQGVGLGSHLLRRAEGILLNFRCRFVKLRVPQWREDVLLWASERGYKETGGGVWGELDGECKDDLTRPTRYFVLTRDLLTDETVAHNFGEGTARYTSAAADAAATTAATATRSAASSSAPAEQVGVLSQVHTSPTTKPEFGDNSAELAGFLAKALRGLAITTSSDEGAQYGEDDDDGASAAHTDVAPMADVLINSRRNATKPRSGRGEPSNDLPWPPPAPTSSSAEHKKLDASRVAKDFVTDLLLPAAAALSSQSDDRPSTKLRISDDDDDGGGGRGDDDIVAEMKTLRRASETVGDVDRDGMRKGAEETSGRGEDSEEEASVESLLGSLMRALNTQQGRADFCRLTSKDSGGFPSS